MMSVPRPIKTRAGIVGIEKSIKEKNEATDATISQAFQDLKFLIGKAQEMVALSTAISSKMKEKQGEISDDETVQFKSYLLSLGIDDPVTRDDCKSNSQYYKGLARQVCDLLTNTIAESGGQMTLPNAYCRVNRARGMDLISPEDLIHACKLLESLQLPLRLRRLSSGVKVLQTAELSDEVIAKDTSDLVKLRGSLAAVELSTEKSIPLLLAQERLEMAEKAGLLVRDESTSGLTYMWNLLMYPDDDLIIPYLY